MPRSPIDGSYCITVEEVIFEVEFYYKGVTLVHEEAAHYNIETIEKIRLTAEYMGVTVLSDLRPYPDVNPTGRRLKMTPEAVLEASGELQQILVDRLNAIFNTLHWKEKTDGGRG